MKEIISIVLITIVVSISSYLVQTYLGNTGHAVLSKLEELKKELIEAQDTKEKDKVIIASKEVLDKWEEVNDLWSMIVIHEELDMIKLSLLEVNAAIEAGSYDDGLEEIAKAIYLVEHLQDKEALKLKNIF